MRAVLIALVVWLVSVSAPAVLPPIEYELPHTECDLISLDELHPPSLLELLARAERRHGLPDGLLVAVAWVESRHRTDVVGAEGEIGPLQLHPRWHEVPDTTEAQLDYAAEYLVHYIQRGGLRWGVSAYNKGAARANPECAYARMVMQAWWRWRQ